MYLGMFESKYIYIYVYICTYTHITIWTLKGLRPIPSPRTQNTLHIGARYGAPYATPCRAPYGAPHGLADGKATK